MGRARNLTAGSAERFGAVMGAARGFRAVDVSGLDDSERAAVVMAALGRDDTGPGLTWLQERIADNAPPSRPRFEARVAVAYAVFGQACLYEAAHARALLAAVGADGPWLPDPENLAVRSHLPADAALRAAAAAPQPLTPERARAALAGVARSRVADILGWQLRAGKRTLLRKALATKRYDMLFEALARDERYVGKVRHNLTTALQPETVRPLLDHRPDEGREKLRDALLASIMTSFDLSA